LAGVIWLSKTPNKSGEFSLIGNKVMDPNLVALIQKEVNKDEK